MSSAEALRDHRVLVLAPTGRDAALAASALEQASLGVEVCDALDDLARHMALGAGAALIAEEALTGPAVWFLADVLRRQPPWSDLPLLILTSGGDTTQASLSALRFVEPIGNVSLLERPVRVMTLLSSVHAALRARRRQYEVRDHLAARQQAEAERERLLLSERVARAEVEAANRAKDEFLAILSHELRTPLQPILGWVKLLRSRRLGAETVTRALETIERNVRAQAQIIEDLLDVSRIVAGNLRVELRSIDFGPVIEAAIEAVRPAAEAKSIQIVPAIDPAAGAVSGDAHRLQQAVWNLLSNAVAFTPEGGRIDVRLMPEDNHARLEVTDTGPGIAPQLLPHVFERFRQGDSTSLRRHGGLGLGLAIVRHLVERHGGEVTAQSPGEGQGATFILRLPLLEARAEAVHSGGVSVAPAPGDLELTGVRVLVVDNDLDTTDLLTTVLRHYGADVRSACSVPEALIELERFAPEVVVTDVSMPGEGAYSLVRKVRALQERGGARVHALALTAYEQASDAEQAYHAGFEAHVAKPVEPAELALTIARLVGREDTGRALAR